MGFADELRKNTKPISEIQIEKGIEYSRRVETAANNILKNFKAACMNEAKVGNRRVEWIYKPPLSPFPYVFSDSKNEYSNIKFAEDLCVSLRNKLCNENFTTVAVNLRKLPANMFTGRREPRMKLEILAIW